MCFSLLPYKATSLLEVEHYCSFGKISFGPVEGRLVILFGLQYNSNMLDSFLNLISVEIPHKMLKTIMVAALIIPTIKKKSANIIIVNGLNYRHPLGNHSERGHACTCLGNEKLKN